MASYLTCLLLVVACCAYSGGNLTYNCPVRAGAVDYSQFNPYNDGLRADTINSLAFQTMGNNDAHILPQNNNSDFNNKVVEIVIGGWGNSQSVIRNQQQGPALSTYRGPVLSGSSFRWFWISWNGGCVKVGEGSIVGESQIMEWCGLNYTINGIRFSYGYGSGGTFIIPIRPLGTSIICESSSMYLSCPPTQVLHVYSGVYGRTQGDVICPHSSILTTNCVSQTSTALVQSLCNGRNQCLLEAGNDVFGDPCGNTYKYLEVKFACF